MASAFRVNSQDHFYVVGRSLLPELREIIAEIDNLGRAYEGELPQRALEALQGYIALDMRGGVLPNYAGEIQIQVLAALASFRSQFEYLIRDAEADGRNLTELAFEHLRRQLVVDEIIRAKWQNAFSRHETHCEQLGAVHLLSHGIWAFKVAARGGATDLVFGDPLERHAEIARRTARALVLTEWKRVESHDEIMSKAQEGRTQAGIYSGGVMGDAELKRTRYVVLVCESDLTPPEDFRDPPITYRHIVLPVSPEPPSTMARSQNRRAR